MAKQGFWGTAVPLSISGNDLAELLSKIFYKLKNHVESALHNFANELLPTPLRDRVLDR